MTNLSTLWPNKNSSSKKGKLLTQRFSLALSVGTEGVPGHLVWMQVTLDEEWDGVVFGSLISEGCICARGAVPSYISPSGLWVQPPVLLN